MRVKFCWSVKRGQTLLILSRTDVSDRMTGYYSRDPVVRLIRLNIAKVFTQIITGYVKRYVHLEEKKNERNDTHHSHMLISKVNVRNYLLLQCWKNFYHDVTENCSNCKKKVSILQCMMVYLFKKAIDWFITTSATISSASFSLNRNGFILFI